jgi:hypothetical protein
LELTAKSTPGNKNKIKSLVEIYRNLVMLKAKETIYSLKKKT